MSSIFKELDEFGDIELSCSRGLSVHDLVREIMSDFERSVPTERPRLPSDSVNGRFHKAAVNRSCKGKR